VRGEPPGHDANLVDLLGRDPGGQATAARPAGRGLGPALELAGRGERAPVDDPSLHDPQRVGTAGAARPGDHQARRHVGRAQDAGDAAQQHLYARTAAAQRRGALVAQRRRSRAHVVGQASQ
jgi:hypothetical protein